MWLVTMGEYSSSPAARSLRRATEHGWNDRAPPLVWPHERSLHGVGSTDATAVRATLRGCA
jgi:hypothetical protein